MKQNELTLADTELSSRIDLTVTKEDVVNVLAVRREKLLRDEKEALTKENKELLAKRDSEDKEFLDVFNKFGIKKIEPVINALNEMNQSLSKYVRPGYSGDEISCTKFSCISQVFDNNGQPFRSYTFGVTGVSMFNNAAFETVVVTLPTKLVKYGADRLSINPKILDNAKRISELNKDIGDIAYNTRLMHAQVVEQTLNGSKDGVMLLKSLT